MGTFAAGARSSATLALNAAGRLEGLLSQLDQSAPLLASCALGHHLAPNDRRTTALSQTSNTKHTSTSKYFAHDQSSAAAATKSMIEQLKVGALVDVIARARATLADARRQ